MAIVNDYVMTDNVLGDPGLGGVQIAPGNGNLPSTVLEAQLGETQGHAGLTAFKSGLLVLVVRALALLALGGRLAHAG